CPACAPNRRRRRGPPSSSTCCSAGLARKWRRSCTCRRTPCMLVRRACWRASASAVPIIWRTSAMIDASCPQDADLLPFAAGENGIASVHEHVAQCPSCQKRLAQIQAEIETLRRDGRETEYFASLPFHRATKPDPPAQQLAPGNQEAAAEELSPTTTDWRTRATPVSFSDAESLGPALGASPRRIGKYVVVAPLDQGGQAQVYRVLHPSLGKELVLKLGRGSGMPAPAGCGVVEEGKILADLDHPNLARIYDLDFHEGQPFLVMEYIRGRTLAKVAKEER